MNTCIPGYRQVVDYYLRDDVSQFMWELSNRRPLKFYYHSDVDLSSGGADAHRTPHGIRLHCVESVAELKRSISEAAKGHDDHAPGFTPFFGMANVVNGPGERDEIIGWDMRFEFDYDLSTSFRVLIPILAVLEHLGVPVLAKYSGQRSLHLSIPAEAFPAEMREKIVHQDWLDTFQALGDLFCLFSPMLNRGSTFTSKEMVFTTPYSFHRYHGLLSIPLSLAEAMDFDPARAKLENFTGISWHPERLVDQGNHIAPLLDMARNRTDRADAIIEMVKSVFSGERWQNFTAVPRSFSNESDSVASSLIAGLPQANSKTIKLAADQAHRFERARIVMDSPEAKETRFYRLVGFVGFEVPTETLAAVRSTLAAALACWVYGGLDEAVTHLLALAKNKELAIPITCAVRISSFLPETDALKIKAIAARWNRVASPSPSSAFLALALAELSASQPAILEQFFSSTDPAADILRRMLSKDKWLIERRPDLAVATLRLAFGADKLDHWKRNSDDPAGKEIIHAVFGDLGDEELPDKFKFAAQKLLKQIELA